MLVFVVVAARRCFFGLILQKPTQKQLNFCAAHHKRTFCAVFFFIYVFYLFAFHAFRSISLFSHTHSGETFFFVFIFLSDATIEKIGVKNYLPFNCQLFFLDFLWALAATYLEKLRITKKNLNNLQLVESVNTYQCWVNGVTSPIRCSLHFFLKKNIHCQCQ